MSTEGVFMCLVAALGPQSKSFEEVRVEDYIQSFKITGRPPPPVPQEPTDEFQRKALGLPPLFKPQTEIKPSNGLAGSAGSMGLGSGSTSSSSLLPNATTKPKIVNPADIPAGQEFRIHIVAAEKYQSIGCMPEYEGFSAEELRYYAYRRGNITSPVPIVMDPFTPPVKETTTTVTATTSDEKLQSQCALPEYGRHSPEELRVAFMLFGREMNSSDLLGPEASATPSTVPSVVPPALTGIPPPVIAAPTAPKFNFTFR